MYEYKTKFGIIWVKIVKIPKPKADDHQKSVSQILDLRLTSNVKKLGHVYSPYLRVSRRYMCTMHNKGIL